ncbi:hypothetical protein K435DRAFT_804467 [Dendrothele bispora CBS 962.96]|uniref:Peptidase A2 domain-containing protein n=1 Tax=Dendrothele bispora (strain CBS 962.96) TaxID=1314807 RepID=A0A4S8LEB6_DENBC|nr:hypothetical protein K435DRAFT_804467 [Dendrothele bispora CBS 962.96]
MVRTRLAEAELEDLQAQDEYEDLYCCACTGEEDFHITQEDSASTSSSSHPESATSEEPEPATTEEPTNRSKTFLAKPALNRRSRRRLAREIQTSSSLIRSYNATVADTHNQGLIELRKGMERPPGCTFLGSKATKTAATVNGFEDGIPIIVDSGSDITLISEQAWKSLASKPKIRNGQNIRLLQVTGSTQISGYVPLDLYFHCSEGLVKLAVEAYVVKGMSTPFILGNDFQSQYSLSLIRKEGKATLCFGDTGRNLEVTESSFRQLQDQEGNVLRVHLVGAEEQGLPRHSSTRRRKYHRGKSKGDRELV